MLQRIRPVCRDLLHYAHELDLVVTNKSIEIYLVCSPKREIHIKFIRNIVLYV